MRADPDFEWGLISSAGFFGRWRMDGDWGAPWIVGDDDDDGIAAPGLGPILLRPHPASAESDNDLVLPMGLKGPLMRCGLLEGARRQHLRELDR